MRIVLLLLSISLLLVQGVFGQGYSCRDKQGRLHFSDKLSKLPPECLQEAQELEPLQAGNLNVVPAAPAPTAGEVERQAAEVEREEQQKQSQIEQLERRAQELVDQYWESVKSKNASHRSWKYGSRGRVLQADKDIQQARAGKLQLLGELSRARIATDKREQIKSLLEQIGEQ